MPPVRASDSAVRVLSVWMKWGADPSSGRNDHQLARCVAISISGCASRSAGSRNLAAISGSATGKISSPNKGSLSSKGPGGMPNAILRSDLPAPNSSSWIAEIRLMRISGFAAENAFRRGDSQPTANSKEHCTVSGVLSRPPNRFAEADSTECSARTTVGKNAFPESVSVTDRGPRSNNCRPKDPSSALIC